MTYKILIVDDSKLARMAVGKALKALRADWPRIEATNADDALALVVGSAVDLALVDFNMPGRDGLQLAAQLRQLNKGMPVAVISANQQTEIVNRARQLGATFLPKPLTQEALDDFLTEAELQLQAHS